MLQMCELMLRGPGPVSGAGGLQPVVAGDFAGEPLLGDDRLKQLQRVGGLVGQQQSDGRIDDCRLLTVDVIRRYQGKILSGGESVGGLLDDEFIRLQGDGGDRDGAAVLEDDADGFRRVEP